MFLDSLRKNKKHPVFSRYRKLHIDDVVEAISLMDVQWLEYLLDENLTYSDFPKWVFIKKLKLIFDFFQGNRRHTFKLLSWGIKNDAACCELCPSIRIQICR